MISMRFSRAAVDWAWVIPSLSLRRFTMSFLVTVAMVFELPHILGSANVFLHEGSLFIKKSGWAQIRKVRLYLGGGFEMEFGNF